MYKLSLIIVFVLAPCQAFAGLTVSGKVLDKRDRPVHKASVYILALPILPVFTNQDGRFEIEVTDEFEDCEVKIVLNHGGEEYTQSIVLSRGLAPLVLYVNALSSVPPMVTPEATNVDSDRPPIAPNITGVFPDYVYVGKQAVVTVRGANFTEQTVLRSDNSAVRFADYRYLSENEILLTVEVDRLAKVGWVELTAVEPVPGSTYVLKSPRPPRPQLLIRQTGLLGDERPLAEPEDGGPKIRFIEPTRITRGKSTVIRIAASGIDSTTIPISSESGVQISGFTHVGSDEILVLVEVRRDVAQEWVGIGLRSDSTPIGDVYSLKVVSYFDPFWYAVGAGTALLAASAYFDHRGDAAYKRYRDAASLADRREAESDLNSSDRWRDATLGAGIGTITGYFLYRILRALVESPPQLPGKGSTREVVPLFFTFGQDVRYVVWRVSF